MAFFLLGVGFGLVLALAGSWLIERLGRHWDTRGDLPRQSKHQDPYSWD